MNDELVRTQYVILNLLRTGKATNFIKSMTLAEISEQEGRNSPNTLYKHIKILQDKGLVQLGAKAERAYGYYLSEAGMQLLKKYDDMEDE